jgi:hypothetical protein
MVEIKFKDPEIKVIGVSDHRDEVWRISRPHLKVTDKELMDIRKVDLPVHSFAFVSFEITGSILLRDILYHVRPTSDWARSNRTTAINKDTLFYSGEYENSELDIERWKYCTDESMNLDIRKDKFPYTVSTDFCWGGDLRTIATVLKSMEAELPAIWEVYGNLFLNALKNVGLEILPPGRSDLFSSLGIPDEYSLKEYEDGEIVSIPEIEVHDYYDTVMIQYRGKGSLLSQFIRQHIARVRSTLITEVMKCTHISDTIKLVQDDLYDMQVITTIEGAKKLIATRACWFAKFDMASRSSWNDIISTLIKRFNLKLTDVIPCKGDNNACPWKTEQLARCIAANPTGSKGEVNPPCPYITGIPEMISIRKAKFNSNSTLFKLWEAEKNGMDLKITEHGIQYVTNVKTYGFVEESDNHNEAMKRIIDNIYASIS